MILVNVRPTKEAGLWVVEVQNGKTAYRTEPLNDIKIEKVVNHVVMGMIASRGRNEPLLKHAIPDPIELTKPLTDGIGLSDNHKDFILVKKGKVQVLETGLAYQIAYQLMTRVGKAVMARTHLKGEW